MAPNKPGNPPNRPLYSGQLVNRPGQPPAAGSNRRGPEEELPEELQGAEKFVDSVLNFFEGGGPERAKFAYVASSNSLNCQFCGEVTSYRLLSNRRGEESRMPVCEICKESIGLA